MHHQTAIFESILDDCEPQHKDTAGDLADVSRSADDSMLPQPDAWQFALFYEIKNDENPLAIDKLRHILDTYADAYNIYTIDTPESAEAIEMIFTNIVAIQKGQLSRNSTHYIIEFDCHHRPYIPIFWMLSVGKAGLLLPKKMIYYKTLFYDYARSLENNRVQYLLSGQYADENEIYKCISYAVKKGGVKEYPSRIKKFIKKIQAYYKKDDSELDY